MSRLIGIYTPLWRNNTKWKMFKKCILKFFEENGVCIDQDSISGDVDLREYLIDSMQYIYFLVELERMLDTELPDEILLYDNLSSLNGFSNLIATILDTSQRGDNNE